MPEYPEFYNSIPHAWDYLSGMLCDAYKDRNNAFRTMNIAYNDTHNMPVCRTVVVRECATDMSYIQFHTDYRSPKVLSIQANPQIAVNLYSPKDKLQLSMNGTATVHYNDAITRKAWHKTQFISRKCYLSTIPPSDVCDIPHEYDKDYYSRTLFETEHGYYHFAVIRIDIKTIDFLYLHVHNNRRIIFTKHHNDNQFIGQWCTP